MLSAIFSTVGLSFVNGLIDRATGLFEAYLKKQITLEELRTQLLKAVLELVGEIEKAHADALTKTYATFMQAASQSLLLRFVWAAGALSQLGVLLWHQVGIPAFVYFSGHAYPSSGETVEWAYALFGAMVGLGPLVLRTGPGKLDTSKLAALVGKK